MTRCEEIQSLLHPYLDSELPEELTRKLERHLLRCPACAYEVQTLEQARTMLRDALPKTEASSSFRERASARLLTALAPHLHGTEKESDRQWTLPFAREEAG